MSLLEYRCLWHSSLYAAVTKKLFDLRVERVMGQEQFFYKQGMALTYATNLQEYSRNSEISRSFSVSCSLSVEAVLCAVRLTCICYLQLRAWLRDGRSLPCCWWELRGLCCVQGTWPWRHAVQERAEPLTAANRSSSSKTWALCTRAVSPGQFQEKERC